MANNGLYMGQFLQLPFGNFVVCQICGHTFDDDLELLTKHKTWCRLPNQPGALPPPHNNVHVQSPDPPCALPMNQQGPFLVELATSESSEVEDDGMYFESDESVPVSPEAANDEDTEGDADLGLNVNEPAEVVGPILDDQMDEDTSSDIAPPIHHLPPPAEG